MAAWPPLTTAARSLVTAAPDDWDVVLRPHWTPLLAYAAAFLIAVAHVARGLLLKVGSSGVVFQTADQVAMGALGLVLAGRCTVRAAAAAG